MKSIIALLLTGVLVFAAAGCGNASGASGGGKVYKITYGGTVPDTHQNTKGAYYFKEIIEERSEGRIRVKIYPNNQIGAPRDLCEGLQLNTIQMADNSPSVISGFTSALDPLTLPFMFPSREAAFAFAEGPVGQEITERVAKETGIRICGWGENGIRHISNSKRSILTPDDMKGLKIRVMQSPVYIKIFEALGASATPMSFAELFTALQQKTVDGQDNPYSTMYTNKLYEVQAYMSDLAHVFDFGLYLVSEEFYQKLPDDLRQVFDECIYEATVMSRELLVEEEKEMIKVIGENLELTILTDEQRSAFKEKSKPVYDWFKSVYPDEADNVDRYIAEIERLTRNEVNE
ncbi:MAG: TRAP transporter substrate-binding protein [Clostridiales bacterium]|nr:TRAP transporter substrate-binding protein [Clostridiales bacterium]